MLGMRIRIRTESCAAKITSNIILYTFNLKEAICGTNLIGEMIDPWKH